MHCSFESKRIVQKYTNDNVNFTWKRISGYTRTHSDDNNSISRREKCDNSQNRKSILVYWMTDKPETCTSSKSAVVNVIVNTHAHTQTKIKTRNATTMMSRWCIDFPVNLNTMQRNGEIILFFPFSHRKININVFTYRISMTMTGKKTACFSTNIRFIHSRSHFPSDASPNDTWNMLDFTRTSQHQKSWMQNMHLLTPHQLRYLYASQFSLF